MCQIELTMWGILPIGPPSLVLDRAPGFSLPYFNLRLLQRIRSVSSKRCPLGSFTPALRTRYAHSCTETLHAGVKGERDINQWIQ